MRQLIALALLVAAVAVGVAVGIRALIMPAPPLFDGLSLLGLVLVALAAVATIKAHPTR